MHSQNPLKLTKHEKLLVIACVILGALLDGLSGKYLMYIMPYGKNMAITWSILRISGNMLEASAFSFIVLRRIKIFRRSNFNLRRIILIIASLVLVLALVAFNIWHYTAVQNIYQNLESATADMVKSELIALNKDLPPEKKSRLSFLRAQTIFISEGRLIDYISPDGTSITFTPSAEDQSIRNMALFRRTYSGSAKKIATANSLSWLIALIVAFGLGFTSKIQRSNEAN